MLNGRKTCIWFKLFFWINGNLKLNWMLQWWRH